MQKFWKQKSVKLGNIRIHKYEVLQWAFFPYPWDWKQIYVSMYIFIYIHYFCIMYNMYICISLYFMDKNKVHFTIHNVHVNVLSKLANTLVLSIISIFFFNKTSRCVRSVRVVVKRNLNFVKKKECKFLV